MDHNSAISAFLFAVSIAGQVFRNHVLSSQSTDESISSSIETLLPRIDLNIVNAQMDKDAYLFNCKQIANAFHKFGAVLIKDDRVGGIENSKFQDLMERYFEQSDGVTDARPQYAYQVGVTPMGTEKARSNTDKISRLIDKPLTPLPAPYDRKWRFFWRIGPRPVTTNFPSLNMEPVIPKNFPQWADTMDSWGAKMMDALFIVSEMLAVGFKLPPDAFTSRMEFGPHLLAPTGSNLAQNCEAGAVLAGFHYDLNFLTIHGKSRYPGLYIWTREGIRREVKVPDGYLLVQAGKQIEYLTGGYVMAGLHEVIVTEAALQLAVERKRRGESVWRVSSTCFAHIQSDQTLEPLYGFKTAAAESQYPPMLAGHQVQLELKAISLDRN